MQENAPAYISINTSHIFSHGPATLPRPSQSKKNWLRNRERSNPVLVLSRLSLGVALSIFQSMFLTIVCFDFIDFQCKFPYRAELPPPTRSSRIAFRCLSNSSIDGTSRGFSRVSVGAAGGGAKDCKYDPPNGFATADFEDEIPE